MTYFSKGTKKDAKRVQPSSVGYSNFVNNLCLNHIAKPTLWQRLGGLLHG